MQIEEIFDYCIKEYNGLVLDKNWGERGVFYNPGKVLPKGIYVLTIKEKDGPNDKASNVNRENVYRLNLGLSKASFVKLFGPPPQRPSAGSIVYTGHNFEALNEITPHPVYGWMSWVAVLNPSVETFERLKPLISEAVALAKLKFEKKAKNTRER
ncbi:hypothetical protein JQC75_08945 [Shewanella litorisediminis]|uniref:DUF6194 domain-containing protein n=2 Tax=Shewanella litorisediminis TaxID=1173586 RepID=A0ABX7G8F3_9GAMM|nr:hypothetical protein JQC75_08945 [Shewanella litorisediminis]